MGHHVDCQCCLSIFARARLDCSAPGSDSASTCRSGSGFPGPGVSRTVWPAGGGNRACLLTCWSPSVAAEAGAHHILLPDYGRPAGITSGLRLDLLPTRGATWFPGSRAIPGPTDCHLARWQCQLGPIMPSDSAALLRSTSKPALEPGPDGRAVNPAAVSVWAR